MPLKKDKKRPNVQHLKEALLGLHDRSLFFPPSKLLPIGNAERTNEEGSWETAEGPEEKFLLASFVRSLPVKRAESLEEM